MTTVQLQVVRSGGAESHIISLPTKVSPYTIGRHPSNDLKSPENDPNVSRRHCEICVTAEGVGLRDLGSTHGTFVNGARVQSNREVKLLDGDSIVLGQSTTVYKVRISSAVLLQGSSHSGSADEALLPRDGPGGSEGQEGKGPSPLFDSTIEVGHFDDTDEYYDRTVGAISKEHSDVERQKLLASEQRWKGCRYPRTTRITGCTNFHCQVRVKIVILFLCCNGGKGCH